MKSSSTPLTIFLTIFKKSGESLKQNYKLIWKANRETFESFVTNFTDLIKQTEDDLDHITITKIETTSSKDTVEQIKSYCATTHIEFDQNRLI